MKYFEQAQENLKRSNFFKALELFQISLKEDALSDELKVFCCEKIEKINRILSKETTAELLLFLAHHYFDLGHFQKSQEFYGKLFLETREISFLKKQFESLRSSGDVAGSIRKSNDYLELLYKRRLSDEIILFINENRTLFKPSEISSWTLRACILSGNIVGLEEELESWSEFKNDEREGLCQDLLELTGHDAKYWHSSKKILAYLWDIIRDDGFNLILSRKRVIKLVLDNWLTSEKDQELLRQTITVAEKYKLPIVGHNIAKYVGDIELGEKFLGQMPRSAFQTNDFDFGEDLFNEETSEGEERKLERDIRFLLKTGKKADVLKLTYKLEKINPSHPLVMELIGEEKGSSPKIAKVKVEELLKEIDRYTPDTGSDKDVTESFIGIVKHYDYEFVQENYEDMIIGFNLINLPKVALEVIKKVDKKRLADRALVNLRYLEIETNLTAGNFYTARDLSEDTLASVPLVDEERISISYLRAESYYQLGNLNYAKQLFKSIAKKTPNYRLTGQRILRLEEN